MLKVKLEVWKFEFLFVTMDYLGGGQKYEY